MRRKLILCALVTLLLAGCASERESQKQGGTAQTKGTNDKEAYFNKARDYLENRDYVNALINIIKADRSEGDEDLAREVRSFHDDFVERLNARAIFEEENIEVGKGVRNKPQLMVFYMEDEIIYPVFNMPVYFSVSEGGALISGESFTNTSGVAECSIMKVEELVQNKLVITSNVSLDIDGEMYTLNKLRRGFILHRNSPREASVAFVVLEKNIEDIGVYSSVKNSVEQCFTENGFAVLQGIDEKDESSFQKALNGDTQSLNDYSEKLDTDLMGLVYTKSDFSSKVSDNYYFARGNIVVKVINVKTGELFFNVFVEGKKGAGNTLEKAGRKAIEESLQTLIENLNYEIALIE